MCIRDRTATALDGRYAIFAYIVDGLDVALSLAPGDVLQEAKVVSGAELLERSTARFGDIYTLPSLPSLPNPFGGEGDKKGKAEDDADA